MTFRITASISDLVIEFKVKAMFNRFLQRYGKKEKAILQALIASLFITGMLAFWRQFGTTLEFLELYSRDWMFQFKKDAAPDSRVLIVGITEKDIQTYGYPIPDKTIAELLHPESGQSSNHWVGYYSRCAPGRRAGRASSVDQRTAAAA